MSQLVQIGVITLIYSSFFMLAIWMWRKIWFDRFGGKFFLILTLYLS